MKSKMLLGLVAACCLVAFAAAGEGEAKKLQGTWEATGVVADGKKMPAEVIDKFQMRLTFDGAKYAVKVMGKLHEGGTFKIIAGKTPAQIDLLIQDGEDKGKTQHGIFKLDGDTLTVALLPTGSTDRPKGFESKEGSKVEITTLKRSKK